MILEKEILKLVVKVAKQFSFWSSIMSANLGGDKAFADNADTGVGLGVQNKGKTCWRNT